ncbi:MOSC domain-containing protein [Enemella evansiae]|uniref:MOSC domain-containing protein n=1 Tax=Enemella evansiae TaxID=2016499 RepID=UPI000B975A28|nr:MOSC N-terminal beta barrel domain-containing protein [Enemella evansiae]OYO01574.1 MOSC domain-containing protein [Enemella evansiae]
MEIVAVHRYPVKSMGGERLSQARVDRRGLTGDRWYAVADAEGHFASGKNTRRFRRYDPVFGYAAVTVEDGVRVNGPEGSWLVGEEALDAELSKAFGAPARVTAEAEVPHQDAGRVSIVGTASLAWCAERWGGNSDPRRTRTNLVVATDEPFIEDGWVGHRLAVGGVELAVVGQAPRCLMVDLDQDGIRTGVGWLKPLGRERALNLAVYADVDRPGLLSVGDAVRVLD